MTPQARKCLDFIAASSVCPSYDEIAAHLGIRSKSGVCRLIDRLEARGLVERAPNRKRCLRVVAPLRVGLRALVADYGARAVAAELSRQETPQGEAPQGGGGCDG